MNVIDEGNKNSIFEGLVTPEAWQQAAAHSQAHDVTQERALLDLGLTSYEQLGARLSERTGLPYLPVVSAVENSRGRNVISAACSQAWGVCPIAYAPHEDQVTVAVHDAKQIGRLLAIMKFFMVTSHVRFTIASESEIAEALRYRLASQATRQQPDTPPNQSKRRLPALRKPAPSAATSTVLQRDTSTRGRRPALTYGPDVTAIPKPPYEAMSRSLLATTASMVSHRLGDGNPRLALALDRVRYCRLLADRLSLPLTSADALTLAAWISLLDDPQAAISEVDTPYPVQAILSGVDLGEAAMPGHILSLVTALQSFRQARPAASHDMDATRAYLDEVWANTAARAYLADRLLQVLSDEEFLTSLHDQRGRVLIVNIGDESLICAQSPLHDRGYTVEVAATIEAARLAMATNMPDLVMCEEGDAAESGLVFCQELRQGTSTSALPVIVVGDDQPEHEAAALRAGADAFIGHPLNLDLLLVKLARMLEKEGDASVAPQRSGVGGSLADMDFTDMIQILCAGGKTVAIRLTRGKQSGSVFLDDGMIVHAEMGKVKGRDAFFKLMVWHEGEFTTAQGEKAPETSINLPAMSLLMEGSRLVDEGEDSSPPLALVS